MNELRLCWVQHGGEASWLKLIIEALRVKNVETSVVTILKETDDDLAGSGIASTFISSEAFNADVFISEKTIQELDQKYGPPNINSIAKGEMALELLFGQRNKQRVQVIARSILFWEKYFSQNKTDYLIVRETASFATRTAYIVGKHLGIPLMRGDIGPDDNHFTLTDIDEEALSQEVIDELLTGFRKVSNKQRDHVDIFVANRVAPPKGEMRIRPGGLNFKGFVVEYLRSWVKEKSINFRIDPIAISQERQRRKFMWKRTIWKKLSWLAPYENADDERYVLFPLYFVDEGMTRARYSFWAANIVPLVREIATNLPIGYKLYVKEHPAVPGDLWPLDIWKICRIPNVKLVSPEVQNQDLIRGASAVVVIQGTAGWETFLLRRPLLVLSSEVYYGQSELVYSVNDICKLSATLHNALIAGSKIYDDRKDEWYWFIHCILNSSMDGCFARYDFPYFQEANTTNANLLSSGIANKMRRYCNEG